MNAPPPGDPEIAGRIASTIELWAKIAGGVIGIWALLAKVWKPYVEWRREQLSKQMRETFAHELAQLDDLRRDLKEIVDNEHGCAEKMEIIVTRQEQVFEEFDLVAAIMRDIHYRADETNDLLDAMGFTSDRRSSEDKKRDVEVMLARLQVRQTERRRALA